MAGRGQRRPVHPSVRHGYSRLHSQAPDRCELASMSCSGSLGLCLGVCFFGLAAWWLWGGGWTELGQGRAGHVALPVLRRARVSLCMCPGRRPACSSGPTPHPLALLWESECRGPGRVTRRILAFNTWAIYRLRGVGSNGLVRTEFEEKRSGAEKVFKPGPLLIGGWQRNRRLGDLNAPQRRLNFRGRSCALQSQ